MCHFQISILSLLFCFAPPFLGFVCVLGAVGWEATSGALEFARQVDLKLKGMAVVVGKLKNELISVD